MSVTLKEKNYKNQITLAAIIFIAVGVFVRIIGFGEIPAGFNQDEAFAAYESFSLLNYGVDSAGNTMPTFFVSWGSGMNVLESYLAIPFMWIFGCSETVFRLPQLICAIASMPIFFLLLKRLFNDKIAIIGLGLLAISPWHIMLSRWGLESNLAPAFLLFGFYFFIKGIEKNGFFLLSALFYGLSLYTYSTTWLAVPIMIFIFVIYIIKNGIKIKPFYFLSALIILFLLALPHILFLLVNGGIIGEIKTNLFTIPKMVDMRNGDVAVLNIFGGQSIKNLFKILFLQQDGIPWNAMPRYGMFYHISLPFFIIGIVKLFRMLFKDIKDKKLSSAYFVLGGFFTFVLVSLTLLNLNINKSNGMHLFTLSIISVGIYATIGWFSHRRAAAGVLAAAFAFCFVLFFGYYFGDGRAETSSGYANGIGDAVVYANSEECQKIAVDRNVYHSHILFYDKTDPKTFKSTVEYENYPDEFLKAKAFGKYTLSIEYNRLGEYDAYIFPLDHLYFFDEEDFSIKRFEDFCVAIRK